MAAETNQIIETENSARTCIAVKTPLAFGIYWNLSRLNSHSKSTQKKTAQHQGCAVVNSKMIVPYERQPEGAPLQNAPPPAETYFDSDAQTSGGQTPFRTWTIKSWTLVTMVLTDRLPRSRSLFTANSEISTE